MSRINSSTRFSRILFILILLLIIGVYGKLSLESVGAFKLTDVKSDNGQSLQLLKSLASFDLLSIVFLGELRLSADKCKNKINIFLAIFVSVGLGFAFVSGSRAQVVTVVLLAFVACRDKIRNNFTIFCAAMVIVVPLLFLVFPFLAAYRNSNFSFQYAFYYTEAAGRSALEVMNDVIATRLNYNEAIVRAFDYVQLHGPKGGEAYWNNILGLLPRLIWPNKPLISNDSQSLGHLLGLVPVSDLKTSVGLQVVGEAYFEFGWFGLWVAGFQALIFSFIHKNFFKPFNRVSMTIYIVASIYLLQRDGYFAVMPGLVWLFISFYLFFSLISFFLYGFKSRSYYLG